MSTRFHCLASRFNWPHAVWTGRPPEEYLAWLELRLSLFARYTVPSVRTNYSKPDLWVLLVSAAPGDLLDRLQRTAQAARCPVRLAHFDGGTISHAVRKALAEFVPGGEIWTTRLDTDDMLSSDFFARLRRHVPDETALREGVVVSFPGGSNYDSFKNQFYFSCYPENPFLTLAEKVEDLAKLQTVFHKPHVDLIAAKRHACFLRSYHPMWASVIHDGNLANQALHSTNTLALGDLQILLRKFGLVTG